jgi:MoxR-like ATPase
VSRPERSPGGAFTSLDEVRLRLLDHGYLSDASIVDAVFLADRLGKPVLVEGPAGVGKTDLAKTVALATGRPLIRLQCYEGLDEAKALYEWDYRKQLLRMQAQRGGEPEGWQEVRGSLFSEEFLLARPLMSAIVATEPVVLLVDEVDRVEPETEALLLEVLSDFQVSVPELGTIRARTLPLVFLTSNGTRELSEALRRRCLYLPVGYPTPEREAAIIRLRVPEVDLVLATAVARIVAAIRQLKVRKLPSISEAIDWTRALGALGLDHVDEQALARTLALLLKHPDDLHVAARELRLDRLPR